MRGAHLGLVRYETLDGIIPAYAGSTPTTRYQARQTRDHPRVCGEHAASRASKDRRAGSSPRMRGAPGLFRCRRQHHGIIPAYAGSTDASIDLWNCRGDHPRVCGEHPTLRAPTTPRTGSSPRMRGALELVFAGAVSAGIIPAYAGSTRASTETRCRAGDHPRVCGEHGDKAKGQFAFEGSSPRMRGAQASIYGGVGIQGIIPAYAGSTSTHPPPRGRSWDHPRVCGEHDAMPYNVCCWSGSSPRMRGAPTWGSSRKRVPGIIPAYAGSTAVP